MSIEFRLEGETFYAHEENIKTRTVRTTSNSLCGNNRAGWLTFETKRSTTSLYAGTVAALGMVRWLMWQYAARSHRLVDKNLDEKFIAQVARRALISPAIFALSIGIAFFNPMLAMLSWW